MSNAPDRFALFILGPGEKRVEISEDTQIPNAATVTLNKEDHTMGNMLRHAVLSNPSVLFSGYRVPHPLEPRTTLKIQTDGSITPVQALQQGCEKVISTVGVVRNSWKAECAAKRSDDFGLGGADAAGPYGAAGRGGAYGGGAAAYGTQGMGMGASAGTGYGGFGQEDGTGGDYVDI